MAKREPRTDAQKRSSRGRTCQKKGRRWQKIVAAVLSTATGVDKDEFFSNQGGDKGDEDVHMSAAARACFPFWIECKNTKLLSIKEWIRKLDEDREAAQCELPGVVISKLYGTSRALVVIELPAFLEALHGPLSPQQRHEILKLMRDKPKSKKSGGSKKGVKRKTLKPARSREK